jgi:acid phosphatase
VKIRSARLFAGSVGLILTTLLLLPSSSVIAQSSKVPINHIIVIYQENHTFDNLYGKFPAANNLDQAGAQVRQVDKNGVVYQTLPQPLDTSKKPPEADPRFPDSLPNAPFPIDQYVSMDQVSPSPVHRFYQHQLQMDGGKMDRYVAWTNAGGLPMGYYDTQQLPLYPYARDYTLADNFFTAAFGGSMLNHFWLICACTPVWPGAPLNIVAQPEFDTAGALTGLPKDGDVTPDGYVVNDVEPLYKPHKAGVATEDRMPPQTLPTIGERLADAGISWAWYAEGWDDALTEKPNPTLVFHHQPFVYFREYAEGTPERATHLKDEQDFLTSLNEGTLPTVSFIKPDNRHDEHPGDAEVLASEQYVADLIEQVKNSPTWRDSAIIVTYDDFGGWYDHVAPSVGDRWGPGGRVPMLIISPYARKGFVDHTLYDTTSILKFIEWRYGLEPLTDRDEGANNLLSAFDFGQQKLANSGGLDVLLLATIVGIVSLAGVGTFLWFRAYRTR